MVSQETLDRIVDYVNKVYREERRAVWEEEIAEALGLTLFQAIEAVRELEGDSRLRVEVYEKAPLRGSASSEPSSSSAPPPSTP